MVGTPLPVTPLRRQIALHRTDARPAAEVVPFTIDFTTSFYFHREGRGLLLGMSDPDEEPASTSPTPTTGCPASARPSRRRAPRLLDVGLGNGWAGLYEVTPDHNALIGTLVDHADVLYATGFSGHGFLQAPAVGEVVRDLYLGRTPFVDTAPLSADRFAGDGARPEARGRPEVNLV